MTDQPGRTQDLTRLSKAAQQQLHKAASRIKLVFFDIDGTLLDSNAELPASAATEIKRIQSCGIKTAVASGRPVFAARALIDTLALNDAGLFYTGAVVYDPAQSRLLTSEPLAADDIFGVIEIARREQMHCELYSLDNYYIEQPSAYTDFHTHYLKLAPQVQPFDDALIRQGIYKIQLVVHETREIDKLTAVQAAFPQLNYATGHGADRPEIIFSSVVSPAACKRRAFAQLLDHHRLSADQVMSIGDAGSDKIFLQQAGLGIAMGNASDTVKQSADYFTAHVDDNGLAKALMLL